MTKAVTPSEWDDLETAFDELPLFIVQAPDGKRYLDELSRQTKLFNLMRMAAPGVLGFAIPNAGKRNPIKAKREGIMAGVFDTHWTFDAPLAAWVEMKGYDMRGTAGKLKPQQIEWGNRMHRLGHHVACFFDPYEAVEWLRSIGFPVRAAA